jgi:hypothetical protein
MRCGTTSGIKKIVRRKIPENDTGARVALGAHPTRILSLIHSKESNFTVKIFGEGEINLRLSQR